MCHHFTVGNNQQNHSSFQRELHLQKKEKENTPFYLFTVLCTTNTMPLSLPAAGCILHLYKCYFTSRGHQAHGLALRQIHLKTGVSTAHAGVSSNISGLHICGADAVVIQAEGKAAAGLRLRLRAVPSTPTRRICGCCEHPQSTGRRCRMCDGARILGREGV